MNELYWREPLWLLLSLLPLVLMGWRILRQRNSLQRYADAALMPWVVVAHQASDQQWKNYWALISPFIIWALLAMTAAGPRLLISAPNELLPPTGAAVIIVDHSRSMQASDLYPNRLRHAHDAVSEWSKESHAIKLGLIIFAGGVHVALPPTADRLALMQSVGILDEIQLPTHGSALPEALEKAQQLLNNETGSRAVIVLTDGDLSDDVLARLNTTAAALQKEKTTLHLLGIGTPSPIALTDRENRWLMQDGQAVTTRLNEAALLALAENTGTHYQRLDLSRHHKLLNIWQPAVSRIASKHRDKVLWQELFPWFLIPALLLIIINHLRLPMMALPLTCLFVLAGAGQPQTSYASGNNNLLRAHQAWQKNDFKKAAVLYAAIDGYAARMGEGASCFRDSDIDCAISAFSRAAWQAATDEQRGQAAYNLGNSYFRQGNFQSAIILYRDALQHQPQQALYRNNLDFSKEVQQQIELRRRQETASQRPGNTGRGWRTLRIPDGTLLNNNVSVVLDDPEDNKPTPDHIQTRLTEDQLAEYMQRSQTFASLSGTGGKGYQRQHDWSRFENEDPAAARHVEFWQKLFELEEDVLIHPDTPKTLPGIAPW